MLEFPELTAHMRRDYWLSIIREIVAVHTFIRTYKLEGSARKQAIGKAVRGVARLKAVWSLLKALPAAPQSLLPFLATEELPAGDRILKAMAASLKAGEEGGGGRRKEAMSSTSKERLERLAVAAVRAAGLTGIGLGGRAARQGGGDAGSGSGSGGGGGGGGGGGSGSDGGGSSNVEVGRGNTDGGGGAETTEGSGSAPASAVPSPAAAAAAPAASGGSGKVTAVIPGVEEGGESSSIHVGDVLVGEMTALERAIARSREDSKAVEKAKRTVEEVKVEGIGTNIALMKVRGGEGG